MNSKDNIVESCNRSIRYLLNMYQQLCGNKISGNISFIIRDKTDDKLVPKDLESIVHRNFKKHQFVDMDHLVDKIYDRQKEVSWVDFNLYYTSDEETVVVVYLIRSATCNDKLQYHVGIPPFYQKGSEEKVDACKLMPQKK